MLTPCMGLLSIILAVAHFGLGLYTVEPWVRVSSGIPAATYRQLSNPATQTAPYHCLGNTPYTIVSETPISLKVSSLIKGYCAPWDGFETLHLGLRGSFRLTEHGMGCRR